MKKVFNKIIKAFLCLAICSLVGTVLLIVAYLLPTNKMIDNAKQSSSVLLDEGVYKKVIDGYSFARLNNYTDSLILNEAVFENTNYNVINKSMKVYRKFSNTPVEDFYYSLNSNENMSDLEYGRYWHGNLIIVKPLLLFLNYSEIRIINSAIQLLLIVAIVVLMFNSKLKSHIINFLLTIIIMCPFVISMSLQFSSIFYVTFIAIIIMLKKNDSFIKKDNYYLLFLIIGILANYFDLLTYPLFSLTFPLLFYVLLNKESKQNNIIKNLFILSFFWGVGYFGMWILKLVIGSLLTGENFFLLAIKAAAERSSSNAGRLYAIKLNVRVYLNKAVAIIVLPIFMYYVIAIAFKIKKLKKNIFMKILSFLVVCMFPLIWYFVMSQHSIIHYWFTSKALLVSLASFLCMLTEIKNSLE